MSVEINNIRNIAIIAHVDHGKTTLIDTMFKQSGLFRKDQIVQERILDSMDLEREKGITIAAKNSSIIWKSVKINIIDTPGHADFGGEVERALSMVDGAILLVDAKEGPLPQTRFVLKKALDAKLKIIVVINKIDKRDARPNEVLDEIYDLFIDLDATEEQLNFTVLYAIGKEGIAKKSLKGDENDLSVLFDAILREIKPPVYRDDGFQMLISDLGYSDYLGRLAVGKIISGHITRHEPVVCVDKDDNRRNVNITAIQTYVGINLKTINKAMCGDIVVLSGIENAHIGDIICHIDIQKPDKRFVVDEPTISMKFGVNTSPFAGQVGNLIQSRKIKERLFKETLKNVAIRVEETDEKDSFIVKGRGEFQMIILIEEMRREGFELSVSRPEVIYKYENEKKLEPIEHLFIDCKEDFLGIVTEKISMRKGKMINIVNNSKGRVRLEFLIPSRLLIGYNDEFLTDTKGTGMINSSFEKYDEYAGDIPMRFTGSIVSDRNGVATAYAIFNLQPRGQLFIKPNDSVYEGMVIGEHNKDNDINVNPTKEKKMSNMRAAGKDDSIMLNPIKQMNLDQALHFIKVSEMVEVTPKSVRIRKIVLQLKKRKALSYTRS